jgi:hypothetical protein
MKDRQVTHEGRRLIVPDSGTPFAATVYREKDGIDYEGIIEEGTPYNVESVLPDTLAEELGLNPEADPTPADALQAIAQALIVPLDIQELYKPLIAPLSVSLSGFVEGSYLYYGIPWDSELRIFVRVSKTTAMSGTTAIGTLPSGYRPTEAQTLTAYDTDGNVVSGITVTIGTNGAVSVVGSVDANTVILASYKGE